MTEEGYRTMDFWDDKWTTGSTKWHLPAPAAGLVDNAHLLLPPPEHYRVLVPLCGKTLDLLWLYKEGHRVVGIEGVEKVVKEFGEEHKLNFQVSELSWGKLYQTPDQRLQVYACDLFEVVAADMGRFDAVWDRGSIVAINIGDRARYAALMKQLLQPSFRYLMATIVYTPNETFSGPPCSMPDQVIDELFGDVAERKLLSFEDLSESEKYKHKGIGEVLVKFILLTPKCHT